MTIKSINKRVCKELRPDIEAALAMFCTDNGLVAKVGHGSYDDTQVTFKVALTVAGVDKAKEEFEAYAPMFNLTADDYGKEIRWGSKVFELAGLKPNRPKYPVVARLDGSLYKLPERALEQLAQTPA